MKTLRTLAATALLSWAGLAGLAAPPAPPANANFASERGGAFGLRLDGQSLTRPLARQVHVDRLAPGQHWVDFSLPSPYGPPLRFRTAVWLAPGLETSYVLVLRPGFGPQLRQVGAIPVATPAYGPATGYPGGAGYSPPAPAGPPTGGYYGNQSTAPGAYPSDTPYDSPASPPYGSADPNPAGGYTGPDPAPTGPAENYPGSYGPGNAPAGGGYYPDPAAGSYPLPPAEVQNLAQAMRSRSFDEERLPMAKQTLAQGVVRAAELAELIKALSFDRSRIELAKYGYAHLSDPQNFYRVYDALFYASSIREVQQALGLPQN